MVPWREEDTSKKAANINSVQDIFNIQWDSLYFLTERYVFMHAITIISTFNSLKFDFI